MSTALPCRRQLTSFRLSTNAVRATSLSTPTSKPFSVSFGMVLSESPEVEGAVAVDMFVACLDGPATFELVIVCV